jgi:hypothetical protein
MDLSKMSLEQLKALGYDQILLLQQTQQNLQIIADEIEKRKQSEVQVEAKRP